MGLGHSGAPGQAAVGPMQDAVMPQVRGRPTTQGGILDKGDC